MTLAGFSIKFRNELKGLFAENELRNQLYILYQFYLDIDRAEAVISSGKLISQEKLELLERALVELRNSKPIDYIINQSVFYGREFYVDASVLIPRSETEELVLWIIEDEDTNEKTILDIGSGSGCIPITLKLEGNFTKVDAIEISTEANETARNNAKKLLAQVDFEDLDILNKVPKEAYDIVVSNPPYVKEEELSSLDKNVVEYEPLIALAPKGDPLTFYHRMIEIAPQILKPGGKFYWEIHEDLGEEVMQLLQRDEFSETELKQDMFGRDRLVRATFN